MATITQTLNEERFSEPLQTYCGVSYPDSGWSNTFVNYFKDAEQPPPDTLNSEQMSEHEMRIARRSDESPNVDRTQVRVRNIRGEENQYRVDEQGFTIGHLDSKMQHWRDDNELKRVYFPEVTELLKRELGAKYVHQYEWHVRTGTLEEALKADSKDSVDINGPVRRVHIDESPKSANNEFNYYVLPDADGNEHLKGRPFGIFNVWKPLKAVTRDPLCLCDVRTIQDEDLQLGKVTVKNVGEIENFAIRPPKEEGVHSFSYLRGQQPNEALVFRIYDQRVDGVVGSKRSHGVAHTSFVDPGTEFEPSRQSVEVRSFCIF